MGQKNGNKSIPRTQVYHASRGKRGAGRDNPSISRHNDIVLYVHFKNICISN